MSLRRTPLAILCAAGLGCSGWSQRPMDTGLAPVVSTERKVRVTRTDGSVIVLEHPRVVGDSLIGDVGSSRERTALALVDIRSYEDWRLDASRSAKAAGGVAVGAVVVLTVAAAAAVILVLSLVSPGS